MGKTEKRISPQELRIVKAKSLLKAKTPIQKIQKETRLNLKTVQRLQNRRSQRKKGSGRKNILSRNTKISIRNLIYKNPFLTPANIVDMLDLPCSPETVRKYLLELGLSYRNISKKESLNQAKKMIGWNYATN